MRHAAATGPDTPPRPAATRSRTARAKRWLRGEPLGVPSHALVVHFPAALLPTSLVFDLGQRWDPALALGDGAAALLVLGLLGGGVAAGTGLLDWLDMIPGSARRARATRHLLVQAAALAGFLLSLLLRFAAGTLTQPPLGAILVSALATIVLLLGNHLGGLLVYRDAMRVRTGR